jgi:di/tricarboxylate transporter
MTGDILLLLVLVGLAMIFFVFEWLPVDIVTLLLLAVLIGSEVLTVEEAFSGFANDIIVILASIFVLSGALIRTGVMDWLGRSMYRLAGQSESRLLLLVMALSASLSAFVSNTSSTAVLMPPAMEAARKSNSTPSRVLIPLAFASMLGGTCTLIGTSTNIAASGLLKKLGYPPFGLFEFLLVGIVAVVAGMLYFVGFGRRLLPRGEVLELGKKYAIDDYLSAAVVQEDSSLVDKTLARTPLGKLGITVLAIVRGKSKIFPASDTRLRVGDLLIVEATRKAILQAKEHPGLRLEADTVPDDADFVAEGVKLVEALVMPASTLEGQTLREIDFRRHFRASVLAVHRGDLVLASDLRDLRLRVGDVLLVQGREEDFEALQVRRELWLLGEVAHVPFRRRKALVSVAALGGAVLLGALGLLPLSVAFLLGAVTVVIFRGVTAHDVYSLIEWRLLVLIGGMTSVGLAMTKTGAAGFLAEQLVRGALPLGLVFVLGALAALTMLLTQPLSNAAAALVVLPVALSAAVELGVDPRSVAVLVTLAASLSFLTPLEPSCLLVYGPGGYRFRDFVKSGSILTLISFVLLLILVPRLWPL